MFVLMSYTSDGLPLIYSKWYQKQLHKFEDKLTYLFGIVK